MSGGDGGVQHREFPINLKLELLNVIKDYFLGKWVFANNRSKAKMYKRLVELCWKMSI